MIADRVNQLGTETAFAVSAEAAAFAAEGNKVYPFHLGDINLKTPANVLEAGIKAMRDGHTNYSPNAGVAKLRLCLTEALVSVLRRRRPGSVRCLAAAGCGLAGAGLPLEVCAALSARVILSRYFSTSSCSRCSASFFSSSSSRKSSFIYSAMLSDVASFWLAYRNLLSAS